jgi:hypothetical protein
MVIGHQAKSSLASISDWIKEWYLLSMERRCCFTSVAYTKANGGFFAMMTIIMVESPRMSIALLLLRDEIVHRHAFEVLAVPFDVFGVQRMIDVRLQAIVVVEQY